MGNPDVVQRSLGLCPKCGNQVYKTSYGYCCSGGRECGFVIWEVVARKKIPQQAVEDLLRCGETSQVLRGFRGKDGNAFDAKLRLDREQGYRVVFAFESLNAIGKCPECGGGVIESSRAWGCTNWREIDGGCRFAIGKEVAGRKLTNADVLVLLGGGKVGPYSFHTRDGEGFIACLVLDHKAGHKLHIIFREDSWEADPANDGR